MPKVSPIQTSFNAGLLSALMLGRVDFDKYKSGMALLLNCVPLVQGPLTRRPGTAFVARVKDSTSAVRLLPFEFSTTQAYVLELTDQNMRVFKDNASVLAAADTITGATQANPCQITIGAGHTYSNGDEVYIDSVGGMTELNGKRYLIAGSATPVFTLQDLDGNAVDSTGFGAYTTGGTSSKVYDLALPYLEADLAALKFAQSADVLYFAHPSYAPRKLTRTGHASWTLTQIAFLDGPYLNANTTATTLTPSATSGSGVTLTASATTGINGGTGFQTTDVGRLIRIKDAAGNWTWLEITGRTSTTVVTVTIKGPPLSSTAARDTWRLGVWSDTTGWPAAVSFFENRLWWGGPTDNPQRVDGSKSGDYENMEPTAADGTVADDNAVAFTLNANSVNVIRWLQDDAKGLLVGTVGGEWIITPSINGEALTPTNVKAVRPTTRGSADIQALRAGKSVLFVQRAARKLRELAYVFDDDGYRAPDMTVLAAEVTQAGIVETEYQQEPQSIVWCVLGDGTLAAMTYEREQNVIGWHPHTLGGASDANGTAAKVESIAVIPSADGTRDEVWVSVLRYINGGAVRYVEYMTKLWDPGDAKADAWYLDCALQYSGSATATITGLDHAEGETLGVWRDGNPHPDVLVTDGAVTLNATGTKVTLGYKYNSDGQLLRFEAGAADGTAQGKTQRIHRVTFRLMDTLGLKVGRSFDKLTPITFRVGETLVASSPNLFTGDKSVEWEGDYETGANICFRQDQPGPMTLLAVMPQMHTQDR